MNSKYELLLMDKIRKTFKKEDDTFNLSIILTVIITGVFFINYKQKLILVWLL